MANTIPLRAAATKQRSVLRSAFSVLRLMAINFLIFAVLAELISLIYINVTNWPSSKPTYHVNYDSFWADINPVFGVWHRPNDRFRHVRGCFNIEYVTNRYGARDVETSLHSSPSRTVVLGDSFVEGLGLPAEDRLSNILERDTGREHLNFGTGGDFGPLQYALLYKSMAAAFDHDLVIVGVLPDNDFFDMSPEKARIEQPGRYRPYYADDFSIAYEGHFDPNAGEGLWDHAEAMMRAYLASYHVGQYIYARLYLHPLMAARLNWRPRGPYSGYNDYTDVDLARLKKALQDIKSTADDHSARVAVFLIPRANDFIRLHQSGANRLGPVMEQWGHDVAISIKDLLPKMEARSNCDFRSYFLTCDGHWSARGNAVAAQILEPWLDEKKR
jgi:hypothetical protein